MKPDTLVALIETKKHFQPELKSEFHVAEFQSYKPYAVIVLFISHLLYSAAYNKSSVDILCFPCLLEMALQSLLGVHIELRSR
jgi:hypothetical protein